MGTITAAAEESNDVFWTALAAVAAVLALPVMVGLGWLAYRAVWPRRKVRWSARVSPLMSHGAAHTNRLGVTFTGRTLTRPHIVEIELSNVGNKDLEPAHFSSLPLDITSTVPVVALLQGKSKPSVQRVLAATEAPGGLELATNTPFHKGQTLTYVMLVDGPEPKIDLRASVSNTKIERRDPATQGSEADLARRTALWTGTVGAGASLIAALAASLSTLVK
ncbi:hypothetical protein OOK58_27575 [Streptomyces sp. NBC_01728]|uniref:hypothetical protein n=1 Tax=unclassified Streptomyces TaxID=2593676 RepID=UPI00225B8928|nr:MULTISPECIES: hypothetical protein [unclassified Streptomyces]MCX4455739.1 hypothetical protein [Streptomyces sp. NBC_01719]MCX4495099.1 hypothetical protein [Streptomyces sp. NBC_01728]